MSFLRTIRMLFFQRSKSKFEQFIEILIGWAMAITYLWIIIPTYNLFLLIACAIPCIIFILYLILSDGETMENLGFKFLKGWKKSFWIVLIFTIISIPLSLLIWSQYFPYRFTFYKDFYFWRLLAVYPVLAFIQQCFFLGLIYNKYERICLPHKYLAILLSGATFSIFHFPNPALMIFCLAAGLAWAKAYSISRNLYIITISHVILGAFLLSALMVYYKIGPFAQIGRWSMRM